MRPRLKDLFGQVAVTVPEIDAWLRAVPRIEPTSPRAAYYVRAWRVAEKVRDAKRRGNFEQITSQPGEQLEHWASTGLTGKVWS